MTSNIFLRLLQILTILHLCFCEDYDTIVTIPNLGQVGGMINAFLEDPSRYYYQYKGIRYAEFVDRFTISSAKLPWDDIHNGKIEGKLCPQGADQAEYTDDVDEHTCLILTVTTPQDPNNKINNLPVLVFIHGGSFTAGSIQTSLYDPELLAQEDIMVVQLQYRVGIFGWLTDGFIIPKNIGLKDCLLGLNWVHNYIEAFGGDPNQVTIYGESAGAIITSNLWQAPKAAGLFHAAIFQSGTALNAIGFQSNPVDAFYRYLATTSCAGTVTQSPEEQVACLKSLPQEFLTTNDLLYLSWSSMISLGFFHGLAAGVTLEDDSDPDAIVTMTPLQRITSGELPNDAPVLLSITNEEMLAYEMFMGILRIQRNNGLVPDGMHASDPDEAGRQIKIHYGGSEIGFATASEDVVLRFASDLSFNIGYRKYIEILHSRNLPVYCMMFDYASLMGMSNRNGQVGHGDDLFYTWKLESTGHESVRKITYPPEAFVKRFQINRFFGNFVKTRNPTPYRDAELENILWPLVTDPDNVQCLDFAAILSIMYNPKQSNYCFWNDLYRDFAINPATFG